MLSMSSSVRLAKTRDSYLLMAGELKVYGTFFDELYLLMIGFDIG